MKIAVVDYDAGNLKSVETALKHLKADFYISSVPEELLKADKVIFPGVGEASSAMANLTKTGLGQALKEFASTGKWLFGICLGSQIVLEHSEENDTTCLGLVNGNVKMFPKDMALKIPHMGWNQVDFLSREPIFKGIPENTSFYFVHSYYTKPELREASIGITNYGMDFTSVIRKDNVIATQFHPEKSGQWGLKILKNYIDL